MKSEKSMELSEEKEKMLADLSDDELKTFREICASMNRVSTGNAEGTVGSIGAWTH